MMEFDNKEISTTVNRFPSEFNLVFDERRHVSRAISSPFTEAIGAIDMKTKEFLIKIPVSAFEFPNKLMQKHFNDSYLETDLYPECIFKGKINGESAIGELTLHGRTNEINIPIDYLEDGEKIKISTTFKVLLKDYKIKIPKILFKNIAEDIEIKVSSTFKKYIKE